MTSPRALLHIALLATFGCSAFTGQDPEGTHVGNPGATLAFRATSSEGSGGALTFADDGGTVYTLRAAAAHLKDIELYLPTGTTCADVTVVGATCEPGDDKIDIRGPFLVDLITGESDPSLAEVSIPALSYSRIDFRLEEADPDDGLVSASSEMADRSFLADADFTDDGGQPAELQIRLAIHEDARVESSSGVLVTDGGALVVLLDAARWLEGAPIDACLAEGDLSITDGVLLIDTDGDCDDVVDALEDNIKESAQLSSDDDSDDDDDDAADGADDHGGERHDD